MAATDLPESSWGGKPVFGISHMKDTCLLTIPKYYEANETIRSDLDNREEVVSIPKVLYCTEILVS